MVPGMVPALRRLDLRFNIPQLWSAFQGGEDPPAMEENDFPRAWLLWRQELNPHWRLLDVDEAWALDQAIAGMSFGEICGGICEWVDAQHAPMRAASFIKTWVAAGLVSGLD